MTTFDGKAFGREIVAVVKDYVGRRTAPLEQRLNRLEARLDRLEEPGSAKAAKTAGKPVVRVMAPTRTHTNGKDA